MIDYESVSKIKRKGVDKADNHLVHHNGAPPSYITSPLRMELSFGK